MLDGLSSIITTSAASIAASCPRPPIAMPISALARTGASFIPSPANATFSPSLTPDNTSSNLSTLSPGNNSLYTSVIPIASATCLAIPALSPVSITVLSTPKLLRPLIASFESPFISSAITIAPIHLISPSDSAIATYTIVPRSSHGSKDTPNLSISL